MRLPPDVMAQLRADLGRLLDTTRPTTARCVICGVWVQVTRWAVGPRCESCQPVGDGLRRQK